MARASTVYAGLLIACFSGAAHGSIVTFSETVSSASGFDGQLNQFLISSDGQYRVEAYWLNSGGHFHIVDNGSPDYMLEASHGQTGQGIRIVRVDGQKFDFLGMDLYNQAAVGHLANFTTGAGTYTLYTDTSGTTNDPATISFGSAFTNVYSVVVAHPSAAGGSGGGLWDNLQLQSSVPEPATLAIWSLLGLLGLAGFGWRGRRKLAA